MGDRRIVEAGEAFSVTLPSGVPLVVSRGDRYWSDDPLVAGREHLFTDLTVKSSTPPSQSGRASETATDAPGERRLLSGERDKPTSKARSQGA